MLSRTLQYSLNIIIEAWKKIILIYQNVSRPTQETLQNVNLRGDSLTRHPFLRALLILPSSSEFLSDLGFHLLTSRHPKSPLPGKPIFHFLLCVFPLHTDRALRFKARQRGGQVPAQRRLLGL